ncbi:MAG: CehA/McbA family metallohydrolase [Gemmatimonadetes bacterium]|nr:CehA/McbA family metallohydrolase [Gemmatimonadota bacterium]
MLGALPLHTAAQGARRPYAPARYGGNYMHNYHIPPAPSATPWSPEWSPDGREIAFSMMGSIWIVDPATGHAREVVSGPKYYASPAWSPDGRWIAYTADDAGRSVQLEILDLASGTRTPLTTDPQVALDPRWSPDGSRLAWTASRPTGYFNVFVRAIANGTWQGDDVQVTADGSGKADRPYFTTQDMHLTPSWAPDGQHLLLVSNRGVALGSGHVWRVPARANGAADAQPLLQEQTFYQARPHAHPDGSTFVYASAQGGRHPWLDLWTAPLGTPGEPRRLTRLPHDAIHPRWSPDGSRIAFIDNATGTSRLSILTVATGAVVPVAIRQRTWQRPMATLHLRVVDQATARETPARVHLTATDGKLYTPDDAYARLSWANDRVFHVDGRTTTIHLPAGPVTLDVVKGFEYAPTHLTVTLAAGEQRPITVSLAPLADMARRHWYGGSTGVHMHEGGNLKYAQQALFLHAAAEGQPFLANPIAHNDTQLRDTEFWRPGNVGVRRQGRTILAFGQEHRPGFHGHIATFGTAQRLPSLYPVTVGYEGNPGTSLLPSNTDVLRSGHHPKGLTAYVHAFAGEDDPMRAGLGLGKAFMIDAALGTVNALEWATANRGSFIPWYALLNNGFRVAALGGEDTIANLYIMRLIGAVRTYVYCPAGLSADTWFDGARRGRSFVTTGPLVDLTVNGRRVGDDVRLPATGGTLTLRAWVRSVTRLQRVFVVMNGVEVAELPLDSTRTRVDTTITLRATRSGWVHLRAEGSAADRFPLDALYAQAFTNPTWVTVGTMPPRDSASAAYALKWLDMYQLMADAWPGWDNANEKQHLWSQVDQAREIFRRVQRDAAVTAASSPSPSSP